MNQHKNTKKCVSCHKNVVTASRIRVPGVICMPKSEPIQQFRNFGNGTVQYQPTGFEIPGFLLKDARG